MNILTNCVIHTRSRFYLHFPTERLTQTSYCTKKRTKYRYNQFRNTTRDHVPQTLYEIIRQTDCRVTWCFPLRTKRFISRSKRFNSEFLIDAETLKSRKNRMRYTFKKQRRHLGIRPTCRRVRKITFAREGTRSFTERYDLVLYPCRTGSLSMIRAQPRNKDFYRRIEKRSHEQTNERPASRDNAR